LLQMDMLLEQTHDDKAEWRPGDKQLRFADTRLDEQVGAVTTDVAHPTHTWQAANTTLLA